MDVAYCRSFLDKAGVEFDAGLTDAEFAAIERRYGFAFPPDLREFLAAALPVSLGFVNWRTEPEEKLRKRMDWPLEGMCFDIECNTFWQKAWGELPESVAEAFEVAREKVSAAPCLIPILGHRYIPDRPNLAGNPVFSVWQTDIIYYGANLQEYFENEFHYHAGAPEYRISPSLRTIELWSHLAEDGD